MKQWEGKGSAFTEAQELKSDVPAFSHTDLPLQFSANHYHFIIQLTHQSIKTAVFAHITKVLHVFICMYKIFLQVVQLLSLLKNEPGL